jgi:hypothetical protein
MKERNSPVSRGAGSGSGGAARGGGSARRASRPSAGGTKARKGVISKSERLRIAAQRRDDRRKKQEENFRFNEARRVVDEFNAIANKPPKKITVRGRTYDDRSVLYKARPLYKYTESSWSQTAPWTKRGWYRGPGKG